MVECVSMPSIVNTKSSNSVWLHFGLKGSESGAVIICEQDSLWPECSRKNVHGFYTINNFISGNGDNCDYIVDNNHGTNSGYRPSLIHKAPKHRSHLCFRAQLSQLVNTYSS